MSLRFRSFGFALIFAAAACKSSCKGAAPPVPRAQLHQDEPSPIAKVNGQDIDAGRFNVIFRARAKALGATPLRERALLDLKLSIAKELVDDALVSQAAAARGIKIGDAEVQVEVKRLADTFPNPAAFNRYLATYPEQAVGLRRMIRARLEREALIGSFAEPTEQEARAYYDEHRDQYQTPARLRAQEIVFNLPPGASPQALAARRKKAAEVLAMARDPRTAFSALAANFSEAPSAKAGGAIEVVTATAVPEKVWSALSALKPGQTSDLIETPSSLVIVHALGRSAAKEVSFTEARPGIVRALTLQRRASRINDLIASLRKEAKIDVSLERRYAALIATNTPADTLGGLGPKSGQTPPAAMPKAEKSHAGGQR